MHRRTDGQTDGKSPHSTGLCPLLGPLPKENLEYGDGYLLGLLKILFHLFGDRGTHFEGEYVPIYNETFFSLTIKGDSQHK